MIAKLHQARRLHIVIVSPALPAANNGNWQTALRWKQMLSSNFHCRVVQSWPDKFANQDDVMLALHARKSAHSVSAWHAAKGGLSLALVLTGTDLYRDIQTDAIAQASLDMASQLVVLQSRAALALPAVHQSKTTVIFQSTTTQPRAAKTGQHLRALMVGHLRDEKSPETLFIAARLLASAGANEAAARSIYIDHIGEPLDAALGKAAEATAAACPQYRWLGGVVHGATRRQIGRAHVLIHASKIEGGAHVVMEAACSGTPALASRIDGNVGMLGEDYAGYFELGDAAGLANLLNECRRTQNDADGLLAKLETQMALRAPLFAPELEAANLNALLAKLAGATNSDII